MAGKLQSVCALDWVHVEIQGEARKGGANFLSLSLSGSAPHSPSSAPTQAPCVCGSPGYGGLKLYATQMLSSSLYTSFLAT